MNSSKLYYKNINLIRLLSCITILLYHLNILKGGYLAVCIFFVLSGYLSCISAFRKDNFSIKSYYINRLLKLYIPLIIVVFVTIFIVSLFPNIIWLNLKPETTSVLLGYNNFWQLGANLDYFSRHINSPFIHLWYISILLQFDLIFPFIYLFLRKIGDRINKIIPCIITFLIAILGAFYFYNVNFNQNMMVSYYSTFTRIFSLLFGLSLGFIHSYYGSLVPKFFQGKIISKINFSIYLLILVCLFVFISCDSNLFAISMVITTLISCRLIDYSILTPSQNLYACDRGIRALTRICYEVYLVQYPIIFFFQYIKMSDYLKFPIILILIIFMSILLHLSLNINKNSKFKIIRYVLCLFLVIVSICGLYSYFLTKDHTKEMNQLEVQLNENEKLLELKQLEYTSKQAQESNDWQSVLDDLENDENNLSNVVANLNVVGIGDSVMLGAVENLYQIFPNGYFDAQVSRSVYVVNDIVHDLKDKNMLGNPVIINIGANGDCSEKCKKEIIESCGDREIFWVNVTNDASVHINDKLFALANQYNNLHIIDWNSISNGHTEYFYADGIHLTPSGRQEYAKAIYDSIYQIYLNKYQEQKSNILKQHEEEQKNKISFYGNDILLNVFEELHEKYVDAKFIIKQDFSYDLLIDEIEKSIEDDTLTHKIVLAFDNSMNLSKENYESIINLCENHDIYILLIDNNVSNLERENVQILDFYNEIQNNDDYVMADRIHLTEKGNEALINILNDFIK